MKPLCILVAIVAMLAGAASCGSGAEADSVAAIILQLDRGDRQGAQRGAERLMADSAAFASLGSGSLCLLSRALVRMSNSQEAGANEASAARCLARARQLSADSVDQFLQSLTGDDAGRLMVLDRVGTYLEIPRDSLAREEGVDTDYHQP